MKFLIVGLGSVGQRHARNLRTVVGPDVELIAYRAQGRDLVITEQLVAKYGEQPAETYGIRVLPTLEAALAERPRAVFVTNPISFHVPTALAAAGAGCNLFIEKPLGADLQGVDDLRALCTRQDLKVFVGYQLRFHPALQRVHQLLSQGRIGRVLVAHLHFGEFLPGTRPWLDYRTTHMALASQGGGAIRCLSHEIDVAYWLFGMPRRVFTMGGHLSRLEIETEDVATTLLECERDGVRFPVSIHLNFVERPPSRHMSIVGEEGTLLFDYVRYQLRSYDARAGQWEEHALPPFERNEMFVAELRHFIDCLDGNTRSQVDLDDGIATMRICLAALESMREGRAVELRG